MITSDLSNILTWWFVLLALGLTAWPLTFTLFGSFFDRGYIFSKILGLLLVSYAVWLLASWKIVPFGTASIAVSWLGFLLINGVIFYQKRLAKRVLFFRRTIILEEILFTVGLIFWAFIKAHEPSIHGLEKYMDFGFINSILRSDYFPPKDLWMTPLSINYYYFGHLSAAVLTKISTLDPAVAYNLVLSTIFGLTLAASFSLGANLYYLFLQGSKKTSIIKTKYLILAGTFSAFLVTFGGNLHTLYLFFQTYTPADKPLPFWQLPIMLNTTGYWYPNATRFIPLTIHEFPIYSFVVSDLHGHVLNIPFVLLLIALIIKIFHSPRLPTTYYLLPSLLIAAFLMTNVLDGPIYLLTIFIVSLFQRRLKENIRARLSSAFQTTMIILLGGVVLSLPFWLNFKPFGSGIGVICAPKFLTDQGRFGPLLFEADHCARSPIWMLVILWGFFFSVALGFAYVTLKGVRSLKLLHLTDRLVLTLALISAILIIIPELVYVKDIYPAHYRANTVFKFGYQAFIILGLICGFIIARLFSQKRAVFLALLLPLFLLVAIYPYFAINSYFGGLKSYKGLNGLSYLGDLYPTDYKAILWIRDNIPGPAGGEARQERQPVILEAQGDSYTDFARVSANSGLPTVIGWPVHEWLWRGSYDEAGKRSTDVATLYEDPNPEPTQSLIKKYNIQYVFVGDLERQKYKKLDENKFYNLGKVIYREGNTVIYHLNQP